MDHDGGPDMTTPTHPSPSIIAQGTGLRRCEAQPARPNSTARSCTWRVDLREWTCFERVVTVLTSCVFVLFCRLFPGACWGVWGVTHGVAFLQVVLMSLSGFRTFSSWDPNWVWRDQTMTGLPSTGMHKTWRLLNVFLLVFRRRKSWLDPPGLHQGVEHITFSNCMWDPHIQF